MLAVVGHQFAGGKLRIGVDPRQPFVQRGGGAVGITVLTLQPLHLRLCLVGGLHGRVEMRLVREPRKLAQVVQHAAQLTGELVAGAALGTIRILHSWTGEASMRIMAALASAATLWLLSVALL